MDKFNEIWKDRFNQGDIPDADWNTPDSEVWEAILPHVPNKRDVRPFFLWIILGLFLLGIGSMIYFSTAQKSITEKVVPGTKEQSVLAFEAKNPEQNTISTVIETEVPIASKSSVGTKAIDSHSSTKHQRIKNKISTQSSIDNALPRKTEIRNIVRLVSEDNQSLIDSRNSVKTINSGQLVIKEDASLPSPLPLLSTLQGAVESEDRVAMPSVTDHDPLGLPKSKRFEFTIQSGALFWQHEISDQYTNDLSAFDFNYSDSWGWSVDVGAAYSISDKIAVTAGLSYEQIQTHSGHNSSLSYDPSLEQGQATNDYDATLATPYGTAGASFRFGREEDLGEMPVNLLVDFHSKHTIQNVSIPMGLRYYPFGQKSKWIPSANIGVGINYLFGLSNELESIDTHHSAIKYIKTAGNTEFSNPELDRLHFDVRVGVGFDYRISSDLKIGLQGAWAKGINPIFEQDNYQTSINRYQIQARISKQF